MSKLLLMGGIGDFLQSVPFMMVNREKQYEYYVVTHLNNAQGFFNAINIKPKIIKYFSSLKEQIRIAEEISALNIAACPRSHYFLNIPFIKKDKIFDNLKPTVGLQIHGSSFSIKLQQEKKLVAKSIPAKLINSLKSDEYNMLIFGLPDELFQLNTEQNPQIKFISHRDPSESLAYVLQCDAFVGSDSGFKTMSVMSRIPTMVWLADYIDDIRDELFINPYIDDGIMEIFRFKNVIAQFNDGLKKTEKFLRNVL